MWMGLVWAARPTQNSMVMIGSPSTTRHSTYNSTKPPPPYWPHIHGNFHTLPQPMAHPADSRMNPSRDPSFSRSISSLLLHFYSP